MEKADIALTPGYTQRKILDLAITQMLYEKGFESVESGCLETLVEMFHCLIVEIGESSQNYCELSGRSVPVIGDILMSFIHMGLNLRGIDKFAKREGRQIIPLPAQAIPPRQPSLLQAGVKAPHPPHIPNYLPALPDPHTYIRTATYKKPITEYEEIREKAATNKRDLERSLTRFLCRTSATQSLFDTEDNMFPLIAAKPSFPPYFSALNPIDQIFDFEELEYHYLLANRTEDITSKDDNDSTNEDEMESGSNKTDSKNDKEKRNDIKPNSGTNKAILENPNIDNPYLRAAKLPKRNKTEISAHPDLLKII